MITDSTLFMHQIGKVALFSAMSLGFRSVDAPPPRLADRRFAPRELAIHPVEGSTCHAMSYHHGDDLNATYGNLKHGRHCAVNYKQRLAGDL